VRLYLGESGRLVAFDTRQHVFEHDVAFQSLATDELDKLAQRPR
jgi:hypothetical protein